MTSVLLLRSIMSKDTICAGRRCAMRMRHIMITVRFILYVVFWGYVARMIIIIRRQQENSLMLPYVMILMLGDISCSCIC